MAVLQTHWEVSTETKHTRVRIKVFCCLCNKINDVLGYTDRVIDLFKFWGSLVSWRLRCWLLTTMLPVNAEPLWHVFSFPPLPHFGSWLCQKMHCVWFFAIKEDNDYNSKLHQIWVFLYYRAHERSCWEFLTTVLSNISGQHKHKNTNYFIIIIIIYLSAAVILCCRCMCFHAHHSLMKCLIFKSEVKKCYSTP